jgi:hypothetical protein|tara:strand:+ start:373 stop:609 length:237 start_codon:yes stop_codon:yes gene_type:complete
VAFSVDFCANFILFVFFSHQFLFVIINNEFRSLRGGVREREEGQHYISVLTSKRAVIYIYKERERNERVFIEKETRIY